MLVLTDDTASNSSPDRLRWERVTCGCRGNDGWCDAAARQAASQPRLDLNFGVAQFRRDSNSCGGCSATAARITKYSALSRESEYTDAAAAPASRFRSHLVACGSFAQYLGIGRKPTGSSSGLRPWAASPGQGCIRPKLGRGESACTALDWRCRGAGFEPP